MINNQVSELDFSLGDKKFDCVQFKRKLQENLWKTSGAKDFDEYCDYVEKVANESKYVKKAINYKTQIEKIKKI